MKIERAKLRQEKAEKKAKEQEEKDEKRKKKKKMAISDDSNEEEAIDVLMENKKPTKRINLNDMPENSYVIVIYEEEFFPGIILEKSKNGAKVKVMTMAGTDTWKWPEKDDILFYPNEDIVQIIDHPDLKNAR